MELFLLALSQKQWKKVGDRVKTKAFAREIDVPLIEDSKVDVSKERIALREAKKIGWPVMVKAKNGGGGRGMRVVRTEKEFSKAYNEAKGEAKTAFGSDEVFIEKFIENPKHIEVQLLGDKYGNVVHLYERDCSVQRRFQKVVEIGPSLGLKQET